MVLTSNSLHSTGEATSFSFEERYYTKGPSDITTDFKLIIYIIILKA